MAVHDDALAEWLALVLRRQIAVGLRAPFSWP